jgi:HAD superfamily hydrolase (TIGR01509 family)
VKVKVLLFDLGGVLVDYVGPQRLWVLLGTSLPLSDVQKRWPHSKSLRRFETGSTSAETFAAEFVAEWGLRLTPEDFLHEFSTWSRAPYPGALELLANLREKATLACLTNMNAAYWEKNRDTMGFGKALDRCYASHEIGLLKPDREIYAHVIADLKCDPSQIAFFDDSERNVEGARAIGMLGYQVEGIAALRAAIRHVYGGNPTSHD